MNVPLLEQLARQLAQGRRTAQRLAHAADGRYRERAVLQEVIRHRGGAASTPNRVLCGDPLLSLAVLLSERCRRRGPSLHAVHIDLEVPHDDTPWIPRVARWISRLCLLPTLAPEASGYLRAPRDQHALLRLVLDATWPQATLVEALPSLTPGATTLLLADDVTQCLPAMGSARPGIHWIACVPDEAALASLRPALLASGAAVDLETVSGAPADWARRRIGRKPLDAMRAALAAFGATPLADADASPTLHRAGVDMLLGECMRDGRRTLVWVDAPDRRTTDATLCRAITRRDLAAQWQGVVVLGWHFPPTFAQHLALRCDGRLEAFAVDLSLRGRPSNGASIRALCGFGTTWIDRKRARMPGREWVCVEWRDPRVGERIVDWSVDPDHDGEVFRGRWHASRDGDPAQRSMRMRLPWRAGPRRVCIRTFDAAGRCSEVIMVVRHRADIAHRTAPASVRSGSLC